MTEVTYGQLDKVLHLLGFRGRVETSEPKARVYKHDASGALIPLAYFDDDKVVLPYHMGVVQATHKTYGIAEPLDFAQELQKAG